MLDSFLQGSYESLRELVLKALEARRASNGRFGKALGLGPTPDYSIRISTLLKNAQTELRVLHSKLAFALGFNFYRPCDAPLVVLDAQYPNLSRAISQRSLLFGVGASTQFYPFFWPFPTTYYVGLFNAALKECALLPKTRELFNMLLQLSQPIVTIVSGTPQTINSGDTCADFVISIEYAPGKPYNYAPVLFTWEPDASTPGAGLSVIRPYTNGAGFDGLFALMGVQATGTPGTVYLTASSGASNKVVFEITVT